MKKKISKKLTAVVKKMSHHSPSSTISNATSVTCTTTDVTPPIINKESSSKPDSSSTDSLKKLKNKDSEVPVTDEYIMPPPENFKDNNEKVVEIIRHVPLSTETSEISEKINLECLLLSDTSTQCGAPQHVQKVLQHISNSQLNQAELLFLLAYIVALESGYAGQADYEQSKLYLDHLTATSSFHAKNILRLSCFKPCYSTTEDKTRFTLKLHTLINVEHCVNDDVFSLLTGFATGDFLIVTLTPATSRGAKGFSTALSIGRYVLSMQTKNKPLYQRFRKLEELSYNLRDHLFVPMRCQQLKWLECCIYPSLDGMPLELYDNVMKYLSKNQLKILGSVNKSLNVITKDSQYRQPSGAI